MSAHDDLDGRVVLVTGASGGIGSVTAAALGAPGRVRDRALRQPTATGPRLPSASLPESRRLLVQSDMALPGSARSLFAEAVAWRGRVDVVVVNAAILRETPFDGSDELWDEHWEATLRVNVLEPVSLMREAVRHFLEAGRRHHRRALELGCRARLRDRLPVGVRRLEGRRSERRADDRPQPRGATGSSRTWSRPGIVHTSMSEISATSRGGIDALNAALAMGEMVPPGEVADLIAFLSTGRARHLTGATIDVNGATYIR